MLYADSPSGLAPDEVIMRSPSWTPGHSSPLGSPWVTHLEQWERSGSLGDPPGVTPATPVKGSDIPPEYTPTKLGYFLRPETVESFYLLWRTTGDVVWRERGWEVFEALQREARVESGGFASLANAHRVLGPKRDEMQR
jgi:mannosyl-oligosaccharide alpha-1,2-mannosidase